MGFDGALAEIEALGDAGVGQTLGHQFQHSAFARERIGVVESAEQARDDVRIEC